MFKKIFKWLSISSLSLLLLCYLSFTAFYFWNESKINNELHFDKSTQAHSKEEHTIIPLNDGHHSLAKRIQIIEGAQESIELEFFIYDLDLSSQIITKKLIQKAQDGVTVRLLVDFSLPVFKLRPVYAHFLRKHGIKVRYYNTSEIHELFSVQHRSHRKLLIVDGKEVITGGRNTANDYFNLSESFNFLDSDIYISGPIVSDIRKSFDLYWSSPFAISEKMQDALTKEELGAAKKFSEISPADLEIFGQVDKYKGKFLDKEKSFICKNIRFVTDFPGVSVENRRVFYVLRDILLESKTSIVAESPYFVVRGEGIELLRALNQKGIKLSILTNGLYSTDAYYTVSALYPVLNELSKTDLSLYAYNGKAPNLKIKLPIDISSRWGVHSKRAVVDDDLLLIGTYNVDPRSANLNSELLITCRGNKELASFMKDDIESRIKNAHPILDKGKYVSKNLFFKASFSQKLKFYLALPFAWAFDFLL